MTNQSYDAASADIVRRHIANITRILVQFVLNDDGESGRVDVPGSMTVAAAEAMLKGMEMARNHFPEKFNHIITTAGEFVLQLFEAPSMHYLVPAASADVDDWLSALGLLFDRVMMRIAVIQDISDTSAVGEADSAKDGKDLLAALIKVGDFIARTVCDGVGEEPISAKDRAELLCKARSDPIMPKFYREFNINFRR